MFLSTLNKIQPFYYPPDTGAADKIGTSSGKEMSKQDIFEDLMKDDGEEKDIIPLKSDETKSGKKAKAEEIRDPKDSDDEDEDEDSEDDQEDEKEDDLSDLEDDLKEPDEEKLELATPTSRREILKKYPKLFKEFPYLEKAYYREQEFTKLLPTIADAKEAVNKADILDKFEQDLTSGNTEVMLKAVKDNDPKAFNKLVDNYLTTLSKVDEKAYHHVIGNTIKHTISAMVAEGRASNIEQLEQAAVILNQFVFGSSKFTPITNLSTEDKTNSESDEKAKEISAREEKFTQQKFTAANEDLNKRVNSAFTATIESRIDPKDSMSEYVKKTAVREAKEELESLIQKDKRFTTLVDKLWERVLQDDFSPESISRIRSAFVSQAQTLLPSVIQRARNNALKGMGKRVEKGDDSRQSDESKKSNDSRSRRESNKGDESRRNDSGTGNKKSSVPRGMSSLEFLMSDD